MRREARYKESLKGRLSRGDDGLEGPKAVRGGKDSVRPSLDCRRPCTRGGEAVDGDMWRECVSYAT